MTITELNTCSRATFVAALGWIYEHAPWVAEQSFADRPFASLDDLRSRMEQVVERADGDARLALLRAHPDLVPVSLVESLAETGRAWLQDHAVLLDERAAAGR